MWNWVRDAIIIRDARGLLRDCENRLWKRWSTTQHNIKMCLLRTTYLSTPTWTTREGKWTLWYSAVSASLRPRINTICETKRHRQSKQSVVIGGVHWPVCLCNVSSLLGTAWTWCLSCPPFGHRYCDEYTTIGILALEKVPSSCESGQTGTFTLYKQAFKDIKRMVIKTNLFKE